MGFLDRVVLFLLPYGETVPKTEPLGSGAGVMLRQFFTAIF